jgi:hypothetical protein
MDIKSLSLELAAISLIADAAKKRKDDLRAQLKTHMDDIGADRVKAELDGEVVAYVTTTKPKEKLVITNEKRWIEWVEANCPDEVIKAVRESSVDRILEKAFKYVDINLIIDWNGEHIDFLAMDVKEPYLTTKFHSDGREKLTGAFLSNSIDARKVLELE